MCSGTTRSEASRNEITELAEEAVEAETRSETAAEERLRLGISLSTLYLAGADWPSFRRNHDPQRRRPWSAS